MIKAVVFDLDDTLISEEQYIKSGYRHIAKILSCRLRKDEMEIYHLLKELLKKSSKNVFNRLFDSLGITYTNCDIKELVDEYRNHVPMINFFDDVIPCLNILKNYNIKLGIITDGYANAQRQKLITVKAFNYFDEIIITDELGKEYWKPHQKPFELMKEKMNLEFNEIIYVGDNPEKDFYISNIYPIKTIRIHRDGVYRNKSYFNNIKENYSIHKLEELSSILNIRKCDKKLLL